MTTIFFPIAILLAPLFFVLGLLHVYRWYRKRKGFKSPLTGQLLRPPGESLRIEIEEINEALFEALFLVALVPSLISGVLLGSALLSGRGLETSSLVVGAIIGRCFIIYYVQRIFRLIPKRRAFRSGLEGEQAVAEELNKLMFYGYHVYHDFPAEKFNIDHILIGPGGVYAVETKTRSKRKADRGKSSAEVTYDGNRLNFPKGYDASPLVQAKDQASWLAKWLSSAVGEGVSVEPIVTLPGWYVKRIKPDEIPVLNPKEIRAYVTSRRKVILSDVLITRIVHQIDQRCHNIEPKDHAV
jgi:hypothetical protein